MTGAAAATKPSRKEDLEEDKELQMELNLLVEKIIGPNEKLIPAALEMLKYLIRTSTTSMTSVPKPLKYLAPYYDQLKAFHKNVSKGNIKHSLADVISVLAIGTAGGEEAKKQRDCLKYCLMGTMRNIGDWGHEYIRQLESEIVEQLGLAHCEIGEHILQPLIKDILAFNCTHNAEIQACDLLMEIDCLPLLSEYINENTYQRICCYLTSCAKYTDKSERNEIMRLCYEEYIKFGEYVRSLIIGLQLNDDELIHNSFFRCKEKDVLNQLAFICARHLYPINVDSIEMNGYEDLTNILNNSFLSTFFLSLAKEFDVMEPKLPEDVYKTWLEPTSTKFHVLVENIDSAKQNLASTFVNGFVNAGFGCDKLMSNDAGNKWIYRNKEHGMLSATASLGLIFLWDVDGGLTPIDKYLYSHEDYIKSGALLALGLVNTRVRNECDPAFALLNEYVVSENEILQIGAILGIGIAYAGSYRDDILDLISAVLSNSCSLEVLGITSISCGLVSLGKPQTGIPSIILNTMIELNTKDPDNCKSIFMRLMALGLSLCYYGLRDDINVVSKTVEVFPEPLCSAAKNLLIMCAYAGSCDVLIIQELLKSLNDKTESSISTVQNKNIKQGKKSKKSSNEWDNLMGHALGALAVATISFGEEIGMEMVQRIFGHIGRYGEPSVRKTVPLAIALSSVSNPQLFVLDVLTKYSHDSDEDVACNALFGLGLIGCGTNNARLAANLRNLAVFHAKNPSQLFMVRIAQGLVHMGKGTITLNPMHTDRMLIDPVGMAGLIIITVALSDPHALILGKCHYLLYCISISIHPRWLLAVNQDLQITPVTVRVGQAVDVVGKAGSPKTITGIHTHSTPVLLAAGERAELATDQFQQCSPALDGICVLKEKQE
ncbi:hypothetical protein ABEB36_002467 [Hypothenemus hampei]|uniref:26S proteasome non-ATPase regulatory subunit 2 n=1 Tax=Hypothenemus hampei TaxID=57062 RepID=A0ABD1F5V8_HYPHA